MSVCSLVYCNALLQLVAATYRLLSGSMVLVLCVQSCAEWYVPWRHNCYEMKISLRQIMQSRSI